jgi:alpha-tubulin suppressor-like RCC1 family protein
MFALTAAPPAVADVSAVLVGGFSYTCALTKTEGTVKCWGNAAVSGAGPSATASASLPRDAISLSSIVSLAGGEAHACALKSDGAVLCWGDNLYWQIGDPTNAAIRTVKTPQEVVGLGGPVLGLFTGATASHNCVITASFTVKCWGRNRSGNLGDGKTVDTPLPQTVPALSSVAALALGTDHTCALNFAGAVLCWGGNGSGQLGDGSTRDRLTPTPVVGLGSGVADIVAGQLHTCALLVSGGVKCWGRGNRGQLGNAAQLDASIPVDVVGVNTATQIVAGAEYNCALQQGGSVKCWGSRQQAGGGDGIEWTSSTIPQSTPVTVIGLSGPVETLGASYRYACAVVVGGVVECWGVHHTGALSSAQEARATSHLGGLKLDTRLIMAEYRHSSLDYFFLTSRFFEKLLFKAVAPEFQLSGKSFLVNSTGLAAGAKPITRYYFDKVAKAESRGSHFYTLVDTERAALDGLNPSNSTAPRLPYNEGADSYAFTPVVEGLGGGCAPGQVPLYRAFRGARFPDDPNHRFTTDIALYNSLVAAGWDGEGVKMCVSQ